MHESALNESIAPAPAHLLTKEVVTKEVADEAQTSSSSTITEALQSDAAAEAVEATPATDAPAKPKPAKVSFEDIDSVIKAIADQDEVLKTMKQQIQDMLTTNGALRRGIKQIVQDANKNDDVIEELNAAKKKLAMMKQFLG